MGIIAVGSATERVKQRNIHFHLSVKKIKNKMSDCTYQFNARDLVKSVRDGITGQRQTPNGGTDATSGDHRRGIQHKLAI